MDPLVVVARHVLAGQIVDIPSTLERVRSLTQHVTAPLESCRLFLTIPQDDPDLYMVGLKLQAVIRNRLKDRIYLADAAWMLSLAILKDLQLDSKQAKAVGKVSKYWSTKRRPRITRGTAREEVLAYQQACAEAQENLAILEGAIKTGKSRPAEQAEDTLEAGGFRLINTGAFSDKVMLEAQQAVEKATQLLRQHGLGKVIYGDIQVTKQVSRAAVLAFYMRSSDEMFVKAGAKRANLLATILHELGHRLHHKFLSSKDGAIKDLYRKYNTQRALRHDRIEKPPVGDELPYKKMILVVQTVIGEKVVLKPKGAELERATYSVPLRTYHELKDNGGKDGGLGSTEGFPTQYASTSAEEMLAELVCFYCLDKLGHGQRDDLEEIIK
jgi:hypothetical protein